MCRHHTAELVPKEKCFTFDVIHSLIKVTLLNADRNVTAIGERNEGNDGNAGYQGGSVGNQDGNDGNVRNQGGNVRNQGGNVGNRGGNEGDQVENLRIRVETHRDSGGFWPNLILSYCFIAMYHHLSSDAVYS